MKTKKPHATGVARMLWAYFSGDPTVFFSYAACTNMEVSNPWGHPQFSSISRIFHERNHLFFGIPPFQEIAIPRASEPVCPGIPGSFRRSCQSKIGFPMAQLAAFPIQQASSLAASLAESPVNRMAQLAFDRTIQAKHGDLLGCNGILIAKWAANLDTSI